MADSNEEDPKGGLSVEVPIHVITRLDEQTRKLAEQKRWADRRAHPRFSVNITCYCQIDGVAGQACASVGNLSHGGMFLKLDGAGTIDMGARVRVVLELPFFDGPRICALKGKVMRIVKDPATAEIQGAGLAFEADNDSGDRELLAGFLHLWVVQDALD
jgi:Tfp pilus assembly protein PilZ